MMYRLLLTGLLLAACLPVRSEAQALRPDDFARGLPVDSAAGEPLLAVPLPMEVYLTATRADLGDLRVFNAAGEEVPHALYQPAARSADAPPVGLPVFPLRGRPGQDLGELTVRVRRSPSGALVEVADRASVAGRPVRAFVMDASRLEAPIRQLSFTWADTTVDFVTEVVAETSDDLTTWRAWGTPSTLARLRYGDDTLRRSEIALPPRTARYVRLTWAAGETPPPVAQATARTAVREEPERAWTRAEPAEPADGVYVFDQAGVLPVDQVRFELPQPNTLARATLASADERDGPWATHFDGLLYRLQVEGHDLATPPVSVPATADRYWRLSVDPAGGGLGQGEPALELGWTPARLLFVPRGEGPFTIAFGSAAAEPSGFEADELLRLLPGRPAADLARVRHVEPGAVVELGGETRLQAGAEVPWPRVLLWSILLLGVVLLTALSVRLLRQIDRDRGKAA